MTYIEQQQPSVLCPQEPTGERHREWVSIQNTIYARYEQRDSDGEPLDEEGYSEEVRLAGEDMGIYSPTPSYMNLYHVATLTTHAALERQNEWVEAWFFKCPVCNFVLPAQAVKR